MRYIFREFYTEEKLYGERKELYVINKCRNRNIGILKRKETIEELVINIGFLLGSLWKKK